jgi:hypothetical protein
MGKVGCEEVAADGNMMMWAERAGECVRGGRRHGWGSAGYDV